jgi:hypothetical protein
MTRWIVALSLFLPAPALADGPDLKQLKAVPPGVRAQRKQVVFQFGNDTLQVYPRGQTAWLDVYRGGRRISHRPLGGTSWVTPDLSVGLLDDDEPEGWALWIKEGKALTIQAISKNWKGPNYIDSWEDSEFSTTGWSTVGVGRNPENHRIRVVELHESPGEEGENGREMDSYTVNFEWDPAEGRFIKQPR